MVLGCIKMGCWTQSIKTFHVKIILLDKQEKIQEIQSKTTGQDLLDDIFKYLNLIETHWFGLRYQDNENQTHWLDKDKRVSGQIKGISPVTLYLGVKFYAADPCKLAEEITRYQFFLQVKSDIFHGRLPVQEDLAVELSALALQSDLGDYDAGRHSAGYVSEYRFLASQTEEFEARVEAGHRKMRGMIPAQAENRYLEKVKWLDMYGVDLHSVIGQDNIEYFLGLTPSGIIVLKSRNKVGNYFWPRISKIYFKGKFFMLRVRDKTNEEQTYGFETPSKQACKHLWKCCVAHHEFFRLVQVSPGSGTNNSSGLFSLGSKLRGSARSERDVGELSEVRNRVQPEFTRVPSQRYSRRSRSEETERQRDRGGGTLERGKHGSSQHSLHNRSNGNLYTGNSLPRVPSHVTMSLPPEVMDSSLLMSGGDADLSMRSLQYLESRGLFGSRAGHNGSRRGSEAGQDHGDNGYTGHHRRHRSRHRGHGSDDESEVSGVSMASRHRHRDHSGSESESGRSQARKNHRRRKRSGSYKLVETPEQPRPGHRSAMSHEVSTGRARQSGYVNSGAETESELVNTLRRNKRRQRSRSRSPSEARARLPQELVKHFEFGLVEPGLEQSSNPMDIPYINVETDQPVRAVRLTSSGSGRRSRHSSGHSGVRRRLATDHDGGHQQVTGHWTQPGSAQAHCYPAQAQVSTVSSLNQSQLSINNAINQSQQQQTANISSISLNNSSVMRHSEHNNNVIKPSDSVTPVPRHLPPHMSAYQHQASPTMGYKTINTSLISHSPMSMSSLHNGLPSTNNMMSSSSTTSSSSSPRQPPITNGFPPPDNKNHSYHPESIQTNGYSNHDLPSTGLTSLPTYNPVYNNNNSNLNNNNQSPASRHYRQHNGQQRARQHGPASLQHGSYGPPGHRHPAAPPGVPPALPTRAHDQFSRNWPPNSNNPMFDANHVKKMSVSSGQQQQPARHVGSTPQYCEPSGDEMSTEL